MIISAQLTPARRVLHRSRVKAMMQRALAEGGIRRSLTHVHWDVSGKCESPPIIEFEGRLNAEEKLENWEATDHANIVADHRSLTSVYRFKDLFPHSLPLLLTMETKCRQCPPCLKARAWEWQIRAEAEILAAPRTWFGTLTLNPEHHTLATFAAMKRLHKGGTDFADLSLQAQSSEVHTEIGRQVTKWLKRIRKESGARLRYCLVAEHHKSGLEHLHVLVHETNGGGSVKERTLRLQWQCGFSKWNLVKDKGAARYVCKYLTKSSLARVRASLEYGEINVGDVAAIPCQREKMPP